MQMKNLPMVTAPVSATAVIAMTCRAEALHR
jgi:hypothetical protein